MRLLHLPLAGLLLCAPLCAANIPVSELLTQVEKLSPGVKKPVSAPEDEAQRRELGKLIRDYQALPAEQVKAHPSAAEFPGLPSSDERVANVTLSYNPDLVHRWDIAKPGTPRGATGLNAWQETGLYAAPGETVTVRAEQLPAGREVRIIVGCHRDSLLGDKIKSWKRFPVITRSFILKPGANTIANAFGGQLFIEVSDKSPTPKPDPNKRVKLTFSGAVAAPLFILGQDTPATWANSLKHPAPWGTLLGKKAILHVQTSQLKGLADPKPLLEWWDQALALQDELIALDRWAPERMVPDVQISAGFMHSGYPFMCLMVSAPELTDLDKLKKQGNWGFFHELGHNHQNPDWTFPGQTEVTVNFFSLYCMEKHVGLPTGQGHGSLKNLDAMIAKRLATPPDMGPFEQLAPFVSLIRAHGWDPLKNTLRSYTLDPIPAKLSVPEKQRHFVLRYSKFAKSDVSGLFTKLGYELDLATISQLKSLPPFKLDVPTGPLEK